MKNTKQNRLSYGISGLIFGVGIALAGVLGGIIADVIARDKITIIPTRLLYVLIISGAIGFIFGFISKKKLSLTKCSKKNANQSSDPT